MVRDIIKDNSDKTKMHICYSKNIRENGKGREPIIPSFLVASSFNEHKPITIDPVTINKFGGDLLSHGECHTIISIT